MSKIYLIDSKSHEAFMIDQQGLIGRAAHADIKWDDSALTNEHVRVSHKNDNFFVEALSNTSPVLLNGIKILAGQRYLVRKSDCLKVGAKELIFSLTNELPEKTVTKIKNDLFGPPETSFNEPDLKLEVAVDDSRSPVELMKKSRKIILEIQETKKQVSSKIQEMFSLAKEVEVSSNELARLEQDLKEKHFEDERSFFQHKEKMKARQRASRKEVDELEAKLFAAKEKQKKINDHLDEIEDIEKVVELKQKAYAKKVELTYKYENLLSIGLEEKLRQLNQCLRDEQDNYQRLHEVSSSYLSGRKKRYG